LHWQSQAPTALDIQVDEMRGVSNIEITGEAKPFQELENNLK
jgi:hypothetical protein